MSEHNYANSPVKSAQYRIYPTLEIGGRKIRSAYPNVRIKTGFNEPHRHVYTPAEFIHQQNNMNNNNHPSNSNLTNICSSTRGALTVYNNSRSYCSSLNTPMKSPIRSYNLLKETNKASDPNYHRYTHRTE